MNANLFIDSLFGKGYLRVPKIAIKAFNVSRAVFLAYLYDLSEFSKIQGNDDFFATRQKVSSDLGLSERVCDDYFKFFRENGVLISYRKGIADSKKYYKIDNQKLYDLLIKYEHANAESACASDRKNCEHANAESACAYNNNNNKESIITNESKQKEIFSKKDFENFSNSEEVKEFLKSIKEQKERARFLREFLDYKKDFAKKIYEDSNIKPNVSLDLWIKYILSKDKALLDKKRYLCLNVIEKDFKTLFKLQDLGYLEKRLNDAIENCWQGIWFDNDAKAYNKGNFKPQYNPRKGNTGQSVFSDNPDDYINPNTKGVKNVKGAIYEVDLWELTGRK